MSTSIRLNVFQRLLRRWDLVHPYNAGQMMRMAGTADVARWSGAWEETLARHGLGAITLRRDRYSISDRPGDGVRLLAPDESIEAHLTTAMNTRFDNANVPFRPFVCQQGQDCWVGLIYSHWVADSVSIRMLLREWFCRVHDPARCAARPFSIAREGYWSLFGPDRVGWRLDEAALATLRSFSRFRTIKRLRGGRAPEYAMSCLLRNAAPALVPALRRYARHEGVTVNDLFLAAAMEQCARLLPLRSRGHRRNVALGTIVDLRPATRRDLSNTFGMFLGFSNVLASEHDLADFSRLVHKIHLQTQHAKQTLATPAGTLWLYLSMLASRYLPAERSYQFYHKHMPLLGGISNVNLAGSWVEEYHPDPIRQYVRISPTGPMIPVAFTPTSLGDDLHLAMTYRTSVLPHERARQMAEAFLDRIRREVAG